MAGVFNSRGSFSLTPHKVAICALIQVYAPPAQVSTPFPFSSVSQHNRLGLFLLALTKSFDDIVDQKLGELIGQLKEIDEFLNEWLSDHLTRRLSSLLSPDDLFSFFVELRGVLGGPESSIVEDDQIILDPSSNLGLFVRRCILAFNQLSYEGVSHLTGYIGTYYKEYLSLPYEEPHAGSSRNDSEGLLEYENMDLENLVFEKVTEEMEARKRASRRVPFHIHANKALHGLIEDIELSTTSSSKSIYEDKESSPSLSSGNNRKVADPNGGTLLRTNWQIQGYLHEQADAIEKRRGCCFPLNDLDSILKQLQKLAPELHRVHFVRYLNNLHHSDYPAALESLVCYFDYSAGMEGLDSAAVCSHNNFGKYEIALLCMGMMHFHFGHPNEALKVLTEAVSFSQQQSNDSCLAYTLAVICSLLSETGIASTSGMLSSLSPITSLGTSVSIQQQLFVLLRRSMKRAEMLKLKRLVASNHLAMAKFGLTHVERPLLSFGPKAFMELKTCPANVCKEIRLSSLLLSEFCIESSTMSSEGALSTAWLKNLQKPGSSVLSQDNVSGSNLDGVQFCAQRSTIPGSVLQIVGSSYLLRANAWELYGSAPLARINALIHATCFADTSSSDDLALAYTKLIQHIAVFNGYKEAFAAFRIAEQKFLSIAKSRMLLIKLQLLHEHALHRGHLKLAQQVCDELEVLASCVIGVDMELKVEASLRHARTLLAAKQFSQAAAVAHSLFCMCYKFNMQVEIATALLLLAEIHKKSGNAVLGLPYALASLSFCQSFNLDLLRASTTLTLAELWLSLGSKHAKRALTLLHGAFPMILGHGGLELCARAHIAEAKCYLSDPSFSVSDDPELVLEPLTQASNDLQVLEYHELAAEAFYLMAIVYDKLERLEEREDAAASFQRHLTILENPQDLEDDFLFML